MVFGVILIFQCWMGLLCWRIHYCLLQQIFNWIGLCKDKTPSTRKLISYHCMLPKKLFWIKVVEGKDKPTKGSYTESKFERDFGSKIAVLVVIMMGSLWGSGDMWWREIDLDIWHKLYRSKIGDWFPQLSSRRRPTGQSTLKHKRKLMSCKVNMWEP